MKSFLITVVAILSLSSLPLAVMASKSMKSVPIEFATPDSVSYDKALDLNQATEKELSRLAGLGQKRASAIVRYRQKHGRFKSFYELNNVEGFAKLKAKELKDIEDQLKIG